MNYKLIAIDLDGTLLDDKKDIPSENKELLNKLIEKGYEIVIATGRRYWSAKQLTKSIMNNLTILANNGTVVRQTKDDKIFMTKYMDVGDYRRLINTGKNKGLYPVVHVDGYDEGYDIIMEIDRENKKYTDYLYQESKRHRFTPDIENLKKPKVLTVVYPGELDELKELQKEIQEKYPQKYNLHIMYNITSAGGLLEVMHPEGCKWLSLIEYAKNKKLSKEEIIAIGDDSNDIEMLKEAGIGIAMKNGTESVKGSADIITTRDNNEGGLAHTLGEVLGI